MEKKNKFFTFTNLFINFLMLIIGSLSTLFAYKALESSNQFYYTNRPKLVLIDSPKSSLTMQIKSPKFPTDIKIGNIKSVKNDTTESMIFINNNSIIDTNFDMSSFRFQKINIDSLFLRNSYDTSFALFKINLKINLQNKGNVCATKLTYACTDTLSTNTILRDIILGNRSNVIKMFNYLDRFEINSQDVGTSQEINIKNIVPVFINEEGDFILHILVIYQGYDNRYYDTYIKLLYNIKQPDMKIIFEPLYKLKSKNVFVLDKIVPHFSSPLKKINDLLTLKKIDTEYDFIYNEELSDKLNSYFNR